MPVFLFLHGGAWCQPYDKDVSCEGILQNAANKAKRSALRTSLKKFDAAVAAGDKEAASACYADAVKKVDKAAGQNLIHKNNAARKKSSLTKALNGMN